MKRLRLLGRRRNPRARERLSRTLTLRLAGAALATAGIAVIGVGTIGTPFFSSKLHLVDSNSGDVWVDTVNASDTTQAGHEQDPHLPCENFNLWGDDLAGSPGVFTIYSIPASDDGGEGAGLDQDWPDTTIGHTAPWTYTGPDNQILATINVKDFIANAIANGDVAQPQQGYHFKINFESFVTTNSSTTTTADDAKSKTFWVDCTPPTTTTTTATVFQPTTTTTTTTTTSTTTGTTTATKTDTTTTTTTATSATTKSTTQVTTTTTTSISTVVGAPETVTIAGPTVTNNVTVAAPTTVLVPTTLTVTTGNPAAASSSATPSSGVAGATTPRTPSTGVDIEFGVGLALLISGGSLLVTAPRLARRKNK